MLTFAILALGLAQAPSGATVYADRCAMCHTSGDPRTPKMDVLKQKTPSAILEALNNGVMRQQASEMSDAEKRAVAEFLGAPPAPVVMTATIPGPSSATAAPDPMANACATKPPFDPTKGI